jgi:hypothetical protein
MSALLRQSKSLKLHPNERCTCLPPNDMRSWRMNGRLDGSAAQSSGLRLIAFPPGAEHPQANGGAAPQFNTVKGVFMNRRSVGLLCAITCIAGLVACTTAPVPKDYAGPLAAIQDSALSESTSRAQFFYLSKIDGRSVANVLGETRRANQGRGFLLKPTTYQRDVPAGAVTLTLEARVSYGAPIQEMMNASTVYSTERTLKVTLDSNKTYVVKGTLTADKKEVWLEDPATGNRVE